MSEDREYFYPSTDAFYGAYHPLKKETKRAVIAMIGDAPDDHMAMAAVKYLHDRKCNVMTMAPAVKDYSHVNLPIERWGAAIGYLKRQGIEKIGIAGASTTAMEALVVASYYPEISLTVAFSPSDFVMEGFVRDGLDGSDERPADGASCLSWEGEPLPYMPFAYRHPEYWHKLQEEAKATGNMTASREMFEESERRHPLQEEEMIRVEDIRGRIVLVGAEDDAMWDTCRYIRRMVDRLKTHDHDSKVDCWLYAYGTHFLYPQSMLKRMLPVGANLYPRLTFQSARKHPKECKDARRDVDRRLTQVLKEW